MTKKATIAQNPFRQAIITKHLGPTDHNGTRVKAKAEAGSITVSWDYELGILENHAVAAAALADKLEWGGRWVVGGYSNGYVFVDAGE